MKKILIAALLLVIVNTVHAQTTNSSSALSDKEKAALSSQIGNPLVNGKPYSQYKAEQDALKQQQQTNKVAVVLLKDVANNGGTVVQQKQPATEKKPENNSQTQPVLVVDPSLTAKKVDAGQVAIEKNQPAAPNLPPGMKLEAVGAGAESKEADTKTQPAVPSGDKKMSDNRKQN